MLQNNSALAQLKQQIRDNTPRVEGVIKATERGFGFLETEDGTSYFVPPPAMKQVLHGDRVEAVLHEEGEKTTVEPDTLIEQGLERFIARVRKRDGRLAVIPDHPSISNALKARVKRSLMRPRSTRETGSWRVSCATLSSRMIAPSSPDRRAGRQARQPGRAWRVTLARHALEQASPEAGDEWPLHDEGLQREDLTAAPFFTIDDAKTRDMDDALRIEPREGGAGD